MSADRQRDETMPDDPTLVSFLGRWFALRVRDEAVGKAAASLHGAVPKLIDGNVPQLFHSALSSRISGLRELLARIDSEDDAAPAPSSIRGQWLRAAHQLIARWDETDWVTPALELTSEKNPILLSAISQSLLEALEQDQGSRQAIEQIRRLRALDEREFRSMIPLPPAAQAPWCCSDYVFPAVGRPIVEKLDRFLSEAAQSESSHPPNEEMSKNLSELRRLIDAGWPVPRAMLERSLRELLDEKPERRELSKTLRDELLLVRREVSSPAPTIASAATGAVSSDEPLRQATSQLADVARQLHADRAPEAQSFARRLEEAIERSGTATASKLHQELVGCLAFLDEASNEGASSRWQHSVLDRLARIAQTLGGGEVLDQRLIGEPLSRWTDFVAFVGYDDQAPPGEPRRITRVERTGYRLIFSDGQRKALVRARVRIAM